MEEREDKHVSTGEVDQFTMLRNLNISFSIIVGQMKRKSIGYKMSEQCK